MRRRLAFALSVWLLVTCTACSTSSVADERPGSDAGYSEIRDMSGSASPAESPVNPAPAPEQPSPSPEVTAPQVPEQADSPQPVNPQESKDFQIPSNQPQVDVPTPELQADPGSFRPEEIPPYSGQPYAVINGNVPFFTQEDADTTAYAAYGALDELGRCTAATACLGAELMPTAEREPMGTIRPSGWHTVRYDDLIEDKYLFNRCHLIGFQLAGENANERNLLTGTRYMNIQGMLPFENRLADFIRDSGQHVLYRVTPVFTGDELLARGVLMEALSVEDGGTAIQFCVFAYNVQPGIEIDYTDGESRRTAIEIQEPAEIPSEQLEPSGEEIPQENPTYIANKNTGKFHVPACRSVDDMKEHNKYLFYGDRQELIDQGYKPCGQCHP